MSSIPPPYVPPAPRKNKTGLIILIVVLALLGICVGGIALTGFFVFQAAGTVMPTVGCLLVMERGRDAIIAHARENNGILPSAENWQQTLKPRMQSALEELRQVPGMQVPNLDEGWVCNATGTKTGIAYNADLAGKKLDDIKDQATTVVLFETPTVRPNAAEPYKKLDNSTSPVMFGERRGWITIPLVGDTDYEASGQLGSGGPPEVEPSKTEAAPEAPEPAKGP